MKQTVTMMAVFMVALLLVSGFIVAGSLQQAQQLNARAVQIAELRNKLNEQMTLKSQLNIRTQALKTDLSAAIKERDELALCLEEAKASTDEANGAVAVQVEELETTKLSFLQARDVLEASLSEQQLRSDALTKELDEAKAERNSALTRLRALEAEQEQACLREKNAKAEHEQTLAKLKAVEAERDQALAQWKALEASAAMTVPAPRALPAASPEILTAAVPKALPAASATPETTAVPSHALIPAVTRAPIPKTLVN
ncbi:MAG: hypothetical protein RR379_08005 [Clostridia bacterium]